MRKEATLRGAGRDAPKPSRAGPPAAGRGGASQCLQQARGDGPPDRPS